MIALAEWLPHAKDEAFKYTSFKALARREYTAPVPCEVDSAALPSPFGERLLFVDGVFEPGDRRSDAARREARFTVETSTPDRTSRDANALRVMNTALAPERVTLRIAPGTDAGIIELLFLASDHEDRYASHPQIHVELGRGARATLIERHFALGDAQDFTNLAIEVTLGEGARLVRVELQQAAQQATLATGFHATLTEGATLASYAVQLGGGLARADIGVRLAGKDARCELYGLHLGGGRQHQDTHTRVDHLVADTQSDAHYRLIADGGARGVFNGKVVVHAGADRTDAHQSNANLLLSDKAEIDTKPELEIYADDVKCAHGATVGRLDDDALFYLRSRGIDEETARNVLVWAFADTVLSLMPHAGLRTAVEDAVFARLPNAERIREFR